MKKKCCIYTRVSTAAQTEGYSLKAQQERLDNLYDRISGKQVCQFHLEFDNIKKEFMRTFIKAIELYPERDDSGRIIKQISFKFPDFFFLRVSGNWSIVKKGGELSYRF